MKITKIEIEATKDEFKYCNSLSEMCADFLKNIFMQVTSYNESSESEGEDDE